MLISFFSSNIPLYIDPKLVFEKIKFKALHYIQHAFMPTSRIKSDLLNFSGLQNGYHQDFQYLMVSIHLFHEGTTLL